MGGKNPKKGQKLPYEGKGSVLLELEVFLSGKKDLKSCKNIERETEKPQICKAITNRVTNSVVKESFIWLGFKRPSMY